MGRPGRKREMTVSTMPSRHVEHRDDIDGLRAVAVLLVVAFHAAPTLLPGGFIGVDIFFVISGYLITGNILKDLERGSFSYLEFYARRCRRIIPALALVLAAVWLLGWAVLFSDEFRTLGRATVAGATFTTNIGLWRESGYFDRAAELKPLLHLWSLGVEEQFYLLWPPLLVCAYRSRWNVRGIMIALVAASFTANVAMVAHHQIAAFYLLPTRLWELLVGAVLVQIERSRARDASWRSRQPDGARGEGRMHEAFAWLMLAATLVTALLLTGASAFPGWWAAVPTAATCVLIASPRRRLNDVVLSSPVLVFVGLISYPLYLWHWPLLSLERIVEQREPSALIKLTTIVVSIAVAWVTKALVETPLRERIFAFGRSRRLMWACVVSMVVSLSALASAGELSWARQPFLSRVRSSQLADIDRLRKLDDAFPRCTGSLARGNGLSWCFTSAPGDPQIAIFGDSHGYYLLPGFADEYRSRSATVLVIGHTACPPLLNVQTFLEGASDQCVAANALALELLTAQRSIHTVVLSSLGPYYFSGQSFAADHRGAFDASRVVLAPAAGTGVWSSSKAALFAHGLSDMVERLQAAGKQVIFWLDVPELDFRPEECVDERPVHLTPKHVRTPCAVGREDVRARQAAYRAMIRGVVAAHPAMRVFDTVPYLCGDAWCSAVRDGRFLYRDSHHLSVFGSDYLAHEFDQWIEASGEPVR